MNKQIQFKCLKGGFPVTFETKFVKLRNGSRILATKFTLCLCLSFLFISLDDIHEFHTTLCQCCLENIDSSTKCTIQGVLLDVGSLLIKKCQFSAICTKERKENH
jgi:hypothetical protein